MTKQCEETRPGRENKHCQNNNSRAPSQHSLASKQHSKEIVLVAVIERPLDEPSSHLYSSSEHSAQHSTAQSWLSVVMSTVVVCFLPERTGISRCHGGVPHQLSTGNPQGSVLGLLLFSLQTCSFSILTWIFIPLITPNSLILLLPQTHMLLHGSCHRWHFISRN